MAIDRERESFFLVILNIYLKKLFSFYIFINLILKNIKFKFKFFLFSFLKRIFIYNYLDFVFLKLHKNQKFIY